MYYLNEHLVKLNRIFDQNSRDNYIRMDLNENPGGLPEDFIHKVLSTITPELISKYPEQLAFTEKLGKFIGAELEQICLTNGSAEAVRYVIEAYSRPDGKIVSVTPSYAKYMPICMEGNIFLFIIMKILHSMSTILSSE